MIQSLLAAGAIVLLSITSLYINKAFMINNDVMEKAKISVLAQSMATSVVEDATGIGSSFDEATTTTNVTNVSSLTSPGSLGPDNGESNIKLFDDFDDFNNLLKRDTIDIGGTLKKVTFVTTAKVEYVSATDPTAVQNTRTWHKRLSVVVKSPALTDSVTAQYVFSFWYFR